MKTIISKVKGFFRYIKENFALILIMVFIFLFLAFVLFYDVISTFMRIRQESVTEHYESGYNDGFHQGFSDRENGYAPDDYFYSDDDVNSNYQEGYEEGYYNGYVEPGDEVGEDYEK